LLDDWITYERASIPVALDKKSMGKVAVGTISIEIKEVERVAEEAAIKGWYGEETAKEWGSSGQIVDGGIAEGKVCWVAQHRT
jgi:hypothetical protein